MNHYPFEFKMVFSLKEKCKEGFVSFSVIKEAHGHPITVFLWHSSGSGIKVQCVMHDLAERYEVGSLTFSHVINNDDNLSTMGLSESYD